MLDLDFLNTKHALSLSDQKYLKPFLKCLAETDGRITFVIGAGLSIDSGLPGWQQLIERIASGIKPREGHDIASLIRADNEDLLRKAEHVVSTRLALDGFGSNTDLVRNALYDGYPETLPGPILLRLRDLIPKLAGRVSVMTTNFDDVIDTAFGSAAIPLEPRMYTLDRLDEWETDATSGPSGVPILHLHGRVERRAASGNLVLTESEFLEHGPSVKRAIAQALKNSVTIFLGLSITDPNVVGPLWDAREDGSEERFAIFVPGTRQTNTSIASERAYAILKSVYLEDKLRLRPIFLKSYTQLEQLLQETRVARVALKDYVDRDPSKTIAYGPRFDQLLAAVYGRVGLKPDGSRASDAVDERRVSDELVARLKEGGSIRRLLDDFLDDKKVKKRRADLRKAWVDTTDDEVDESFSIALWLRNPSGRAHKPYSIRLVATSSHTYNALQRIPLQNVEIEPNSDHTAALALLRGKGQLWQLPEAARFGMWETAASSLVRIIETVSGETVHTAVGAISLQSTHQHVSANEDPDMRFETVSLLSALDNTQRRALYKELEHVGRDLVTPTS